MKSVPTWYIQANRSQQSANRNVSVCVSIQSAAVLLAEVWAVCKGGQIEMSQT